MTIHRIIDERLCQECTRHAMYTRCAGRCAQVHFILILTVSWATNMRVWRLRHESWHSRDTRILVPAESSDSSTASEGQNIYTGYESYRMTLAVSTSALHIVLSFHVRAPSVKSSFHRPRSFHRSYVIVPHCDNTLTHPVN